MKRMTKWAMMALLICGFAAGAQAQKFGYVNSDAILAQMPKVKQAEANLEAFQKQLQKKGQDMVTKFQQDLAQIQQQIADGELSPKQQEEKAEEFQKRQTDLGKYEQDMMKQVQDKRAELINPILEEINKAIEEVAKEGGYQFIFDKAILLYAEEAQDVSEEVKAKLGL